MNATTHLKNQITAAIGHAVRADKWHHEITEDVLRVIAEHETCSHCGLWSVSRRWGLLGPSAFAMRGSVVQRVFVGPFATRRARRWIGRGVA